MKEKNELRMAHISALSKQVVFMSLTKIGSTGGKKHVLVTLGLVLIFYSCSDKLSQAQ